MDGLHGEDRIVELCRREGISQGICCWLQSDWGRFYSKLGAKMVTMGKQQADFRHSLRLVPGQAVDSK